MNLKQLRLTRGAKVIWTGNGFGIEFVVVDPWCINLFLLLEKDPTLTDTDQITIASNSIYREGDFDDDKEEIIPGTEESMRAFAERARQEALEWAEVVIAEYKQSEDLAEIIGEVLDSFSA